MNDHSNEADVLAVDDSDFMKLGGSGGDFESLNADQGAVIRQFESLTAQFTADVGGKKAQEEKVTVGQVQKTRADVRKKSKVSK